MLEPIPAFVLSFALGFIAGFLFVSIGIGWLAFFGFGQAVFFVQLAVAIVMGVIFGTVGLGLLYLGKTIGRKGLIIIAVLAFVLGIALIQPEIDVFALIPLVFAFTGVKAHR